MRSFKIFGNAGIRFFPEKHAICDAFQIALNLLFSVRYDSIENTQDSSIGKY
jgi:hypothetical protein